MVRDKIKNGDLKITHHQNTLSNARHNDATFLDDNNASIFTIIPQSSTVSGSNRSASHANLSGIKSGSSRVNNHSTSMPQLHVSKSFLNTKSRQQKRYLTRPIILIPLIMTGVLVLVGVASFIAFAVISANRQNSALITKSEHQKNNNFEDLNFLFRKTTQSSSTTSKSVPNDNSMQSNKHNETNKFLVINSQVLHDACNFFLLIPVLLFWLSYQF